MHPSLQTLIHKVQDLLIDKTTQNRKLLIEEATIHASHPTQNVIQELIKDVTPTTCETIVGKDVFRDVEFFENINENYVKTPTVFDVMDNHMTLGGKEISKIILKNPIDSIHHLSNRQNILKNVESKYNDNSQVLLQELQSYEKDVLWLFEDLDQNMQDLYNIVYFRMALLKPFNENGYALTGWNVYKILVSPLIGILSPIIYFVVPFIVITYKLKLNLSFKTYLKLIYKTMISQDLFMGNFAKYKSVKIVSYMFSLLFYFQGVFNSVEISRTLYKISSLLVKKVNNVVKFLQKAQTLSDIFWDPLIPTSFLNPGLIIASNTEERSYINSLNVIEFSLLSNFGEQLKTFRKINKDITTSMMIKTYIIDSLISFVRFKQSKGITYATYLDNEKHGQKPILKVEGLWHPCIDKQKAVSNNISFGCAKNPSNAIITGTNAAGKSLLIKSIIINTLIAQTCTLSISSHNEFTPFSFINSQISIPDCTGHESLFQAEMHRCKKNLDTLLEIPSNKCALIVVDEIFNSTNPIEAIAGGYAICNKLSQYDNLCMIFTTHFNYLTKLAKRTKKFKNYKMETLLNTQSSDITFTYKLKEGVNKHYIALELLKKEGFDESIINEAIEIKNKLSGL